MQKNTSKKRQAALRSARIKTRHENHKNTVCKQFKKQRLWEAKTAQNVQGFNILLARGGEKKRLRILAVLSLMEQCLWPGGTRSTVRSQGVKSPSRYRGISSCLCTRTSPDKKAEVTLSLHSLHLKHLTRRTCYDVWVLL